MVFWVVGCSLVGFGFSWVFCDLFLYFFLDFVSFSLFFFVWFVDVLV